MFERIVHSLALVFMLIALTLIAYQNVRLAEMVRQSQEINLKLNRAP